MSPLLFFTCVVERALGRPLDLFGPDPAQIEALAGYRLPASYTEFLRSWNSDDYAEAPLRCGGIPLRLSHVETFADTHESTSAAAGEAWPARWVVIAVEAEPAAREGAPGPYRSARAPRHAWVIDVDAAGGAGEVLRVNASDAGGAELVAPSWDEFLDRVAVETAETLPPCHPYSAACPDPAAEQARFAALAEAVARVAAVVERSTARPVTPVEPDPEVVRRLAACHALPPIYQRFLLRHASDDFFDTNLRCGGAACWINAPGGMEISHEAYSAQEGWPPHWVVIGTEYEGCYVLDLSTYRGEDCEVLHFQHGRGMMADKVADSLVAFLLRVAEDSEAPVAEDSGAPVADPVPPPVTAPPSPPTRRDAITCALLALSLLGLIAAVAWKTC